MAYAFYFAILIVSQFNLSVKAGGTSLELCFKRERKAQDNELSIELSKDEDVLMDLLDKYDARVLPLENGVPVDVQIKLYLLNMVETKEIHRHFNIEMVMHCAWHDPRLEFDESDVDDLRLVGDKTRLIWNPDIYFEEKIGKKSVITNDNTFAVIQSDGSVLLSQRFMLKMFCPMNFTSFPFDSQTCTIPLSSYAYDDTILNLNWHKSPIRTGNLGALFENVEDNGQFAIMNYTTSTTKRDYGFSGTHDTLLLTIHFQRRFTMYFLRIYLPLILMVCLSFSAFWIDYRSTPARTIMATTIFLTVMVFVVNLQARLPPTTDFRSIDFYILGCFLLVFGTLVEYAFVQTVDIRVRILERKDQERKRKRTERCEEQHFQSDELEGEMKEASNKESRNDQKVDVNRRPGWCQRMNNKIYTEHRKHRFEYHILDRLSKRIFPIIFLTMNTCYFLIYAL